MHLSKNGEKQIRRKILETVREKWLIVYKGNPMRLIADFSSETIEARKEWDDTFEMLKEQNHQPRILYSAKLSFKK